MTPPPAPPHPRLPRPTLHPALNGTTSLFCLDCLHKSNRIPLPQSCHYSEKQRGVRRCRVHRILRFVIIFKIFTIRGVDQEVKTLLCRPPKKGFFDLGGVGVAQWQHSGQQENTAGLQLVANAIASPSSPARPSSRTETFD